MIIARLGLSARTIAAAPLPAVRILAICQAVGPCTRNQLALWVNTQRGAFMKAFNQALELQLIERAPVQALYDPRHPQSPDPRPTESPSRNATPTGADPFLLTPREPDPDPARLTESGTHLSSSSSSSRSQQDPPSSVTPMELAWSQTVASLTTRLSVDEFAKVTASSAEERDGGLVIHVADPETRDLLAGRLHQWVRDTLAAVLGDYCDVDVELGSGAPDDSVIDDLVAAGVWRHLAQEACEAHGNAACRAALERYAHMRQVLDIFNPGGWILRDIERSA